MNTIHLLHVDDEPDIREVVGVSLSLDPDFVVQSCSSGEDAIVTALSSAPDLILLDVMMPVMDGPMTLERLRRNIRTKDIPVLFMTARVQTREIEHFCSIGAQGVIAKPFDPMKLPSLIKDHLQKPALDLSGPRERFIGRAREAIAQLQQEKSIVEQVEEITETLDRLNMLAHKLAGGGGTLGFRVITEKSTVLEGLVTVQPIDKVTRANITIAIDALINAIEDA